MRISGNVCIYSTVHVEMSPQSECLITGLYNIRAAIVSYRHKVNAQILLQTVYIALRDFFDTKMSVTEKVCDTKGTK